MTEPRIRKGIRLDPLEQNEYEYIKNNYKPENEELSDSTIFQMAILLSADMVRSGRLKKTDRREWVK